MFVWAGEVAYFGRSFCDGRAVRFLVKECLPEDAGTFTCLAENSAGRTSSCALVSVQGKRSQFDDSEHSESICVNTNLFSGTHLHVLLQSLFCCCRVVVLLIFE